MNIPQWNGWDIVDQDPFMGTTTLHRYNEADDETVVRTIHHTTQACLNGNKEAQNNYDAHTERTSDMRLVASIPNEVQMIWFDRYGVEVWNKDHQKKVIQLLNDSEWAYLKRTPLVI